MRNSFWKSPVYQIIKEMKARGNQLGLIQEWKTRIQQWAEANPSVPEAQSVLAWLPMWQVRPFYSAKELAPIFPVLSLMLGFGRMDAMSPQRLAFNLIYGGLPRLQNHKEFFVCERLHHWRDRDISDTEFAEAYYGK